MQRTLDALADDTRTLELAAALLTVDRSRDARVVWVVDQCEELFTLCRDERERSSFVANLLRAPPAQTLERSSCSPFVRTFALTALRIRAWRRRSRRRSTSSARSTPPPCGA
jgi:hypothetical protein